MWGKIKRGLVNLSVCVIGGLAMFLIAAAMNINVFLATPQKSAQAATKDCERLYQEAQKALEPGRNPSVFHNTYHIANGISKGLEYIKCLDELRDKR